MLTIRIGTRVGSKAHFNFYRITLDHIVFRYVIYGCVVIERKIRDRAENNCNCQLELLRQLETLSEK